MNAKPKILVIDNNKNILAAFRISLADEGYRPVVCSNIPDALRLIEKERVDLIISEIHLNGLLETGIAFLTKLRHDKPEIPIIVISNQLNRDIDKRLTSLGVKAFFSKPLELRPFQHAVKTLLTGSNNIGSKRFSVVKKKNFQKSNSKFTTSITF